MRKLLLTGALILLGACSASEPEFTQMPGEGNFSFVIPKDSDASKLPTLAKHACGSNARCTVFGWQRPEDVAGALPMTDHELATLGFQYSLNRDTNYEKSLWNCQVYPRGNKSECVAT